jgi:virginiamycin A acetyltransferase
MRALVKSMVRGLAFLLVWPLAVVCRARRDLQTFQGAGQFLATLPGLPGSYLRVAFYRQTLRRCAPSAVVEFGSYFSHWDVEVDERVYIGAYCIVARCVIGKDTMFGSGVHILDGGRQHGTDQGAASFQDQAHQSVRVEIGPGCWVGNQAVVMADLGPRTVVGAGAVVTRPSPGGETLVGVPARPRGPRPQVEA